MERDRYMGVKISLILLGLMIFLLVTSCKEEELALICNGSNCTWVDAELLEDTTCQRQISIFDSDVLIFQCGEFER